MAVITFNDKYLSASCWSSIKFHSFTIYKLGEFYKIKGFYNTPTKFNCTLSKLVPSIEFENIALHITKNRLNSSQYYYTWSCRSFYINFYSDHKITSFIN